MSDVPLPDIPPGVPASAVGDFEKARYATQLDIAQAMEVTRQDTAAAVANARQDAAAALMEARVDADRAAEIALLKSIHDAYLDVIKGTLDRSVTRAQFLTATIGAVSTTYTSLLGINFAVASSRPAPGRALIPVMFLGLGLALAALYVAFLKRTAAQRRLLPTAIGGAVAEERLKTFMEWTFSGVLSRAWALRTAIVAFAVGLAMMPLPFVTISAATEHLVVAAGVLVLLVWVGVEIAWAYRNRGKPYITAPPAFSPPAR